MVERGLYGANLHYQSPETTSFGERRLVLDAFAADPGTVATREEFRGTGGSLYFLRRQDILTGSERVRIEVRDKDSGLVTSVNYLQPVLDYDIDIYKNFYGPFFPQFPTDPDTDFVENIRQSGIYTVGTVDAVRDQWRRIYDEVPCEYITLIYHFAQQPKDSVLRELELFMTKVVPHLEACAE